MMVFPPICCFVLGDVGDEWSSQTLNCPSNFLGSDLVKLEAHTLISLQIGGLIRENPLFQRNLGWWNIIIWPDVYVVLILGGGDIDQISGPVDPHLLLSQVGVWSSLFRITDLVHNFSIFLGLVGNQNSIYVYIFIFKYVDTLYMF